MAIPFRLLQAQNSHEKGLTILRIFCGSPQGEQMAHFSDSLKLVSDYPHNEVYSIGVKRNPFLHSFHRRKAMYAAWRVLTHVFIWRTAYTSESVIVVALAISQKRRYCSVQLFAVDHIACVVFSFNNSQNAAWYVLRYAFRMSVLDNIFAPG